MNKNILIILIAGSICILFLNYNSSQYLVIGFMGDVMIGRGVNEVLAQKPIKYVWGDLLSVLHKTDLNIANLESTLTLHDKPVPKVFNFRSDPKNVEALKIAHIGVVNLANNHSLDFGDTGLEETIKTLDNANILHVGAGMNEAHAIEPVIMEWHGVKIGVIGFTDNEPGWASDPEKPGINYIKLGDKEKIKQQIRAIKDKVSILIASVHWGSNWPKSPSKEMQEFAHAIIDEGVSIIHGHSAHIPLGIEVYKKGLILYSTGDFLDDYAVDPIERNDLSYFYTVEIDKHGPRKLLLRPVVLQYAQTNIASPDIAKIMIRKIQKASAQLGTVVTDDGEVIIPR